MTGDCRDFKVIVGGVQTYQEALRIVTLDLKLFFLRGEKSSTRHPGIPHPKVV